MCENTYPDLVEKFFANLTFSKDGNGSHFTGIRSRVKGKVLKYLTHDLAKIFCFKEIWIFGYRVKRVFKTILLSLTKGISVSLQYNTDKM